jgi:hypothetical protein
MEDDSVAVFRRIASASDVLPFMSNQRGDSGINLQQNMN